jgi:hypothetical protein
VEGLRLHREIGLPVGIIASLLYLGELARRQGEPEKALTHLGEAVDTVRELGHRPATAHLLRRLALAAHAAGDPAAAHAHVQESLALCRELEDDVGITECLELLALTVVGADPEHAARLVGAAAAARGSRQPSRHGQPLPLSHTRPPLERIPSETTAVTARGALGNPAFAAALAAGSEMEADEGGARAGESVGAY